MASPHEISSDRRVTPRLGLYRPDYAAVTRKVITALGGMRAFVKPGNTVVVKPNMGWDRKPEYAANTHPLVVKTIVEECLASGARKVKVFDNTCTDARRSYENCGIPAALKGMKNVDVRFVENDRFRKTALNGRFLKDWPLYDDALKADVLINVPIAKHHGLTGLTLGLKNMMGIMGDNRGYIHRGIEAPCPTSTASEKSPCSHRCDTDPHRSAPGGSQRREGPQR